MTSLTRRERIRWGTAKVMTRGAAFLPRYCWGTQTQAKPRRRRNAIWERPVRVVEGPSEAIASLARRARRADRGFFARWPRSVSRRLGDLTLRVVTVSLTRRSQAAEGFREIQLASTASELLPKPAGRVQLHGRRRLQRNGLVLGRFWLSNSV